jgi:hypothetical protein
MTVGDPRLWRPLFPGELIPQILDLVCETWRRFDKPAADEREWRITRRFKHALKREKDYRMLPVRIERELAEDDPESGDELGRIDLKFNPADSALEEVYFAFECKRLYALVSGAIRALAGEYVSEGMMRFVEGRYASRMQDGGMIGYVLDGTSERARLQVAVAIASSASKLLLSPGTGLDASVLRPANADLRLTSHVGPRAGGFRLHHVFLGS